MSVQPIPAGYHTVTPYLIVQEAARAIDWYCEAFAATEQLRLSGPGEHVGHAEIKIGDSTIMLADEHPDYGAFGPQHYGGSPSHLMIYIEEVDTVFDRAVAAGAEVVRPLTNQFYGDRTGTIKDPFGHQWTLSTHIEDVSQEEVQRRFDVMLQQSP